MSFTFNWLHLSDVHVGHGPFAWQWPAMKSYFFEDLKQVYEKTGGWDLVIFSGDLTQQGKKEEYLLLTKLLEELWEAFDKLGSRPQLFTVPGNHDLVRPNVVDPHVMALSQWWNTDGKSAAIRNDFWTNPDSSYRRFIGKMFRNYLEWVNSLTETKIPLLRGAPGLLPGDSAATLNVNGATVGVVGLNSAFLQSTGENYEKKLDLSGRQLFAITGDDPFQWVAGQDLTFLVTHHPSSWLHDDAYSVFQSDIYTPKLFDAHFFGHMHEASALTQAAFGSAARRHVQAPSLFGLEKARDGKIERIHGYSAGQVKLDKHHAVWRHWPRISTLQADGQRRPVPDYKFPLTDDQCTEDTFRGRSNLSNCEDDSGEAYSGDASADSLSISKDRLSASSRPLLPAQQHLNIRGYERESCAAAIQKDRFVWLDADWGMNADGFIWAVLQKVKVEDPACFRIDASEYQSTPQFTAHVVEQLGCSFTSFCKELAAARASLLILEDVPLDKSGEIREFAKVICDYCPKTIVFVVSRGTPKEKVEGFVQLKALDEMETRTYVFESPGFQSELHTSFAASEIFRVSDGLPGEIDRAIRKLRFVDISELGASFLLDASSGANPMIEAPSGLIKAVSSIAQADDPHVQRALVLLKILTILPFGETIKRLRHFDPLLPVFDLQAEELLERDLIEARASTLIMGKSSSPNERLKLLVAPRPVRDYVRTLITSDEEDRLTNLAMNLYFGDQWRAGSPKLKRSEEIATAEDGTLLHNPTVILLKMLGSAVASSNERATKGALNLCSSYVAALMRVDHYRSAITVCRDVLRILPSGYSRKDLRIFELPLARSLRMIGNASEALPILRRLEGEDWDKTYRASAMLNLALCLEAEHDSSALDIAKAVIGIDPKSNSAMQAKAIILGAENGPKRAGSLLQLEEEARRKGNTAVANNLALDRAENIESSDDVAAVLKEVLNSAKIGGDWYTLHRAVVLMGNKIVDEGRDLTNENLVKVVSAYHYLYAQRFRGLFREAHRVLWEHMKKNNDVKGMYALFRHSSFIWRLNSEEKIELKYMKELLGKSKKILQENLLLADQDTAYFILRMRSLV